MSEVEASWTTVANRLREPGLVADCVTDESEPLACVTLVRSVPVNPGPFASWSIVERFTSPVCVTLATRLKLPAAEY